jgi:hypothetical protein
MIAVQSFFGLFPTEINKYASFMRGLNIEKYSKVFKECESWVIPVRFNRIISYKIYFGFFVQLIS